MISYGDMLDAVEKEEAKNALPTTPLVETPEETVKKENNEDNIEDVIDEKKEDENIEN